MNEICIKQNIQVPIHTKKGKNEVGDGYAN